MNRYATIADLRLRVPAAATLPSGNNPSTGSAWTLGEWNAATQAALDDAEQLIDVEVFATKTLSAHVQLAAHLLAIRFPLSGLGAAVGGAVASLSAGEISASFAVPAAASSSDTALSVFGREFERIAATVMHVPTAVM